jgi:rhodanese-related sulfurtransferase
MYKALSGFAALTALATIAVAGVDFRPVTPDQAVQRQDWQIVDVRESSELAEELGYIEGAVNISLGKILLAQGWETGLDKTKPVLFVCRTGARSARAAAKAIEMGFTEVYSLDGGMVNWNAAGLKVQRVKSEAPAKPKLQLEMVGVPCA